MATLSTAFTNQVKSHLTSKHLTPTPAWLSRFLSTQKATTPLPALKQTALFRLLASDLTTSLLSSANSTFPADILDGAVVERQLKGPIPVQILGIEDVGKSRWSQIEAIEAVERGETTRGREVVRVVSGEENLSGPTGARGGPHKVLLQDARGTRVYGFELSDIEGLNLGMNIGAKLVLKDVYVARGVLMLEPGCASLLGGKIDSLDKAWKEARKAELMAAVTAEQP